MLRRTNSVSRSAGDPSKSLSDFRWPLSGRPSGGFGLRIQLVDATQGVTGVPQIRDYSLMDLLATNGYDVWAIDIHGYGHSDKTDGRVSDLPPLISTRQ